MDSFCRDIREDILRISQRSGHGHIPTCFSVVEMIYAAYSVMRHKPTDPQWSERDIFILSKGHAALAHYCVLARLGYFPLKDVYSFGSFSSKFGCHADRLRVPGVEMSTGSLGHGSGVAAGIALAFKMNKSPRRVFVLIGDGESNEGTVWESLMVAASLKLDNLYILFDNNESQSRCLPVTKPQDKFRAFDCEVVELNGHDVSALKEAMSLPPQGRPKVIIANTVKGRGCRTLVENVFAWHRRSPSKEELDCLLKEI
ncbi:MAG: transketolase [Candidatus Omnitrophota bacterium]